MLTTIELLSCTDRLKTRGRFKVELLHYLYVDECTSEGGISTAMKGITMVPHDMHSGLGTRRETRWDAPRLNGQRTYTYAQRTYTREGSTLVELHLFVAASLMPDFAPRSTHPRSGPVA